MMAFPDDTNAGVDLRPISNPWIGQLGKSRWKACDVSSSLTASGTAYKRDVPAMSTSENPERTRSSDLENPQGVDRQKSALGVTGLLAASANVAEHSHPKSTSGECLRRQPIIPRVLP
jgi:hypothetical protein